VVYAGGACLKTESSSKKQKAGCHINLLKVRGGGGGGGDIYVEVLDRLW